MANSLTKFDAIRARLVSDARRSDTDVTKVVRWFFETLQYPFQLKDDVDDDYDGTPEYLGELRGFYPNVSTGLGDAFFQPYNSMYHKDVVDTDKDRHRDHFGVDIYAPYFPFPHEVPVYALVNGKIIRRWTYDRNLTEGDYQALGNRVRLEFKVVHEGKTLKCWFDYGHLERFALGFQPDVRADGKLWPKIEVEAGDLIGFAGKSGNADTKSESSTLKPDYKVNSGHVHLSFYIDGASTDPLKVLPKPLAFQPSQKQLGYGSVSKEKGLRPLIEKWEGPALKTDPIPKVVRPKGLLLPTWHAPLPRNFVTKKTPSGDPYLSQSRAMMPRPFDPLDFDHSASIRDTDDAYTALKGAVAFTAGLKVMRAWTKAEASPDTKKWSENVAGLVHRAMAEANAMVIPEDQTNLKGEPENAAKALLAMLHLHEAFWVLLGGPAFRRLTKGGVQPACGLGVHGEVRAVAYPKAVAALHDSEINGKWVLSVTFGSGSLRHAMLTETAVAAADADIKPYMNALQPLLLSSQFSFDHTYVNFRGLVMGEKTPIETFQSFIKDTADSANATAAIAHAWTRPKMKKFTESMAEHNSAAIQAARTISAGVEDPKGRPLSPMFKGVSLLQGSGVV